MTKHLIINPINLKSGNPNQGIIRFNDPIHGRYTIDSFTTSYRNYTIFSGVNDLLALQTYGNTTLTEGYYDGTSLATSLSTALTSLTTGSGITVTVTYNSVTNKFTFTTSDSSSLVFLFNTYSNTPSRVLGFNRATTTVTSGSSSLRAADLTPLDAIYMEISDRRMFQGIDSLGVPVVKSIIIPWVSRDQNKVFHKGGNGVKIEIRDKSEFEFKFTDEYNNLLSFLGGWTLTLIRET